MRLHRPLLAVALGAAVLPAPPGAVPAAAKPRVLNVLIDPTGLPALHHPREDGPPVMWLPQFRLFDAAGRPLWSPGKLPETRKEFRQELAARIEARQPVPEARTLRQEARYFLRRGGLPLNLTTLPASELTVVEYWADECGQCDDLSRDIQKYFASSDEKTVKVIRVFVDRR